MTRDGERNSPRLGAPKRGRAAPALFALCVLFVVGLSITYWRDADLYRAPAAPYEDGRDMFGFFYNHPEPSSILRSYNGYVSLIPNLAGYLSARAPVTRVPLLLVIFPLGVAALGFALFSLPAYRGLVENDRLRWIACLTLALAPLGNYMFVSSTTYSVWNLLFLLILLTLLEAPRRARDAAIRLVAMAPLIFSHPLSVALLPIWLAQAWVGRAQGAVVKAYYGVLCAIALLYQLVGVEHAGERAADLMGIARVTGILVLERVFFNTFFSDRLSRILYQQDAKHLVYLGGVAAAVLVVALAAFVHRRLGTDGRLGVGALLYLIVALTALYVIGRSGSLDILTGNPGYRYFWVQRLCLILLVFVLVASLLRMCSGRGVALLAAVLTVLLAVDLVWLNRLDNAKYRSRPGQGRKLARFTAQVRQQEVAGDGSVSLTLPRGVWSIQLERPAGGD